MKKFLVLGASGGMGYAITKELLARGKDVRVFARNKEKLMKLFGSEVEIFQGDVFQLEQLLEAAKDVDIIIHAVNIPYEQWEEKLLQLNKNIWEAAKQVGAKLAVVDNIYAYGKKSAEKHSETAPKNPHTKKGKIRLEIEKRAKETGVPILYAHFPDFYGPYAENSILNYTLKNIAKNKKAMFVGDLSVQREYIFTPDGAKALVELSLTDAAYGQNWNIAGAGTISGNEIIELVRTTLGYHQKVSSIGKRAISFLGLFNKGMKEVVEMLYLTEEPVILDSSKYEREIGILPRTSYKEGILQTIQHVKE
ncbi:SDR family NAD(P)-dependent oxidoreductase [Peribacillus tepidiphilus]|uniref:SDR family NAD(P)-dependent oxidoreductase n=1 Tax=Peribacillus tepidiphilus TaxID=2652445 RepID=UPI001291F98A|nr:SDR family NAD(P)-dependent oxidoreductase [Peribacillus tepidiphilus]